MHVWKGLSFRGLFIFFFCIRLLSKLLFCLFNCLPKFAENIYLLINYFCVRPVNTNKEI